MVDEQLRKMKRFRFLNGKLAFLCCGLISFSANIGMGSDLDRGENGFRGWSEIYNDLSWRKTNFSDDSERLKANKFLINSYVLKTGFRRILSRKYYSRAAETANFKTGVYFDLYGKTEINHDFFSNSWNKNVYSNNEKLGPGPRFKFERRPKIEKGDGYYLSVELFGETLRMFNSFEGSKAKLPGNLNERDTRLGINSWLTYDSMRVKPFFCETYFDFSHHSSNFSNKNQNDYLIFQQ